MQAFFFHREVFIPHPWAVSRALEMHGHFSGRQFAQCIINQRQELLGGIGLPCSMADRMRVTSFMAETKQAREMKPKGVADTRRVASVN